MEAGLPAELSEALGPGDKLSLTWGPETFTPIRFHSFTVGPFAVETTVRPREKAGDAWERASRVLTSLAVLEFGRRAGEYFERVKVSRGAREVSRVKSEG